jgi:hypothetical protein
MESEIDLGGGGVCGFAGVKTHPTSAHRLGVWQGLAGLRVQGGGFIAGGVRGDVGELVRHRPNLAAPGPSLRANKGH